MAWPNRVYAATPSKGIYRCQGFTATGDQPVWAAYNTGLAATTPTAFCLDRSASPWDARMFCIQGGDLYRRVAGGDWAVVLTAAEAIALTQAGQDMKSVITDPVTGYVYVPTYGKPGEFDWSSVYLLRSIDHGDNWTATTIATYLSAVYNMSNVDAYDSVVTFAYVRAIATSEKVCYSVNDGTSWTEVAVSATGALPGDHVRVHPASGIIYGLSWDGNCDVFRLDPTTGAVSYPAGGNGAGPYGGSLWCDPDDADHAATFYGNFRETSDDWATLAVNQDMDDNYLEIARGCETDCWVHGRVNNGAAVAVSTNGYTLSHRSGADYASSPFADSIPTDCGGVIECGLWAVIDPPTAGPTPPGTIITVDGAPITLVGPGLYQAVSMPGHTGIDRAQAMSGDRAAFDVHNYPEEHASDRHEGVSILHLDPDAAEGEGPVMGPDGTYLYADIATQDELDTHEGTADAHHDPVTLDANADTLLSLSTQEVGLDNQDANKAFMGPASGAADVPAFRVLANADLPDPLAFKTAASALGIVSGAVTATQNLHTLTSESGTSDDLDTITAAADRTLLLIQATATHTITVKHGTGNISLNGAADFELTGNKSLLLFWNGTAWVDLGAGGGGGAALTVEEIDGTPSVASVSKIKVTNGTLTDDGSGVVSLDFGSAATDGAAIHDNTGGEIHAITEKASPVSADEILIEDSADSYAKKRVQVGNLPGGAGGATVHTSAYASPPAAPTEGDLWLPNNSFYVLRRGASAWAPWGPVFPMTPPPTLANWTWFNQDAATADETYGAICLVDSGAVGVRGLGRAAPSTPYVITAAILPRVMHGDYKAGVYWADDAGKIITLCITSETPGQISLQKWNSVSSWSGNYASFDILSCHGLFFLRIADDGTNRTCQYSHDGQHWETLHSVGRTDFLTATKAGICTRRANTTRTPALTLLSWEEA